MNPMVINRKVTAYSSVTMSASNIARAHETGAMLSQSASVVTASPILALVRISRAVADCVPIYQLPGYVSDDDALRASCTKREPFLCLSQKLEGNHNNFAHAKFGRQERPNGNAEPLGHEFPRTRNQGEGEFPGGQQGACRAREDRLGNRLIVTIGCFARGSRAQRSGLGRGDQQLLSGSGSSTYHPSFFGLRGYSTEPLAYGTPRASANVEMFSGTRIGLDMERLAYFALSVFWRASVHRWRVHDGSIVFNSLAAFEEPIRRYLTGQAGFPPDVSLVAIACTDYGSQGSFFTPARIRGEQYTGHGMLVRGVHFRMFTGTNFPQILRNVCCYTARQRPIMKASCQRISVHAFGYLHATSRPSRKLGKT